MTNKRPPNIIITKPRAHPDGERLAKVALQRATALICTVRDEGADSIGAFLDRLDTQDMYALTTVLAALVPDDHATDDLLSWLAPRLAVAS